MRATSCSMCESRVELRVSSLWRLNPAAARSRVSVSQLGSLCPRSIRAITDCAVRARFASSLWVNPARVRASRRRPAASCFISGMIAYWLSPFNCIELLNHLFFWPEQYRRTGGMSIVFPFDENPDVASAGSGGATVRAARTVVAGLPATRVCQSRRAGWAPARPGQFLRAWIVIENTKVAGVAVPR
jgi:hypothetical protein